jgi:hypothetical protein
MSDAAGQPSDLAVELFLCLHNQFFGSSGQPQPFPLRHKLNTQDDPFDEHVYALLTQYLPTGITALKATGPLITPDIVILRPQLCQNATREVLATDLTRLVAIEVKKLERAAGGTVARASGMDYNTTPPCGTVRVYDQLGSALDIRGFYLFVCQERGTQRAGTFTLTALALCDGNLLNEDFQLYLAIVGERTKQIGLGTYGDGANRTRPMLIFSNPLGTSILDHAVTLIHARDDLESTSPHLKRVGVIRRTIVPTGYRSFSCYRLISAVPTDYTPFDLLDPFPFPARTERTQPRGRFQVNIRPSST